MIEIKKLIFNLNVKMQEDNSTIRVESLTKTISSIRIDDVNVPRLAADKEKIVAQTAKLKAETEKLGRKSTAESVTYNLDW